MPDADLVAPMTKKIRLGLYMYAPIIGGAEQHFKDLLWRIDRTRFDVFLVCESWPPFDAFLDLNHCPEVQIRRVSVVEMIGHLTGSPGAQSQNHPPTGGFIERTIRRLKEFRDHYPIPGRIWVNQTVGLVLRYLLLPINYYRLSRVFRQTPLDVLHIVNGGYPAAQSAVLAAIAAKRAGCHKVVMSVTNMPFPRAFLQALEVLIDRQVLRSLDRILIPSENIGVALTELRDVKPTMLKKIYYGAEDVAELTKGLRIREELLAQFTELEDGPVVGMVANFLPHKGYRHLIESAVEIIAQQPKVKFVLIGNGPDFDAIVRLVAEKRISGHVVFTGRCSLGESLKLMEKFSVFVLSSELEGMPYVVIHAMNLGLPMVVSGVGAIGEMIIDGHSGCIVPPANVPALRDGILKLLTKPDMAKTMGNEARARYHACFTLHGMIRNHDDLYRSI